VIIPESGRNSGEREGEAYRHSRPKTEHIERAHEDVFQQEHEPEQDDCANGEPDHRPFSKVATRD
jgi:hypothetical protein